MLSIDTPFTEELELKPPIFDYRNISMEFSLKVGNHKVGNLSLFVKRLRRQSRQ
ncbi:MAG: hypothetical protein LBK82_07345 [Planctomycetaceae bacterium]|nr:hypothetical protein [Planctomycetaceae bacterium]